MKITNWNKHWENINNDPLIGSQNPQNWSDYQWYHTLNILDLQINNYKSKKKLINVKMLECGSGTASVSRYFNKKYSFENTILDNSYEALTKAKNFIENNNLNIASTQSDIQNMPFEDNTFDVIYLGGVVEYLDHTELCIKEINRVLKPGGLLLFVVVPNVFNIQIIGDTLLFLKNFLNDKQNRLVPSNVKKWYANKYINLLENNNFISSKSFYLNPFPALPLPGFLKKIYLKLIRKSSNLINKYNMTDYTLKKYLSVSFLIISEKKF